MSKKVHTGFQQQWRQFSPAVQDCLQQILSAHGPAAATLATKALVLQHQEKHHPSGSPTLLRPTSPSPLLGRTMPARLPLQEAIPRVLALDCQAAQVFLGDPSYMRFIPLPQKLIITLQQQAKKAQLVSLIIHASFAINLASAREQARKSSLNHWKGTLHYAERLRATSVVVHLGRYQGPNRERGIDHFLQGMQQSLTTGKKAPPMVLLENSYGASHALGSSLEELGSIYTRVVSACPHWRIGLCLDTAHLWSAGYDLSTEEATRCVLQEIETHIGLQHIKVIHLNNSSSEKDQELINMPDGVNRQAKFLRKCFRSGFAIRVWHMWCGCWRLLLC